MTLYDLKQVVDSTISYLQEHQDPKNIHVLITIESLGTVLGGTPFSEVASAGMGFDWDSGQFRLYPTKRIVELK